MSANCNGCLRGFWNFRAHQQGSWMVREYGVNRWLSWKSFLKSISLLECWFADKWDIRISININSPGPSVGVPNSSAVLRRRGGFPRCFGSVIVRYSPSSPSSRSPFVLRISYALSTLTNCEPEVSLVATTQLWKQLLLYGRRRIQAQIWLGPGRYPVNLPFWVVVFFC